MSCQADDADGGPGCFAVEQRLVVGAGSRATRSGQLLRWRSAGIEQAAAEPSLPFFIEWAHGTPFPGCAPATSPAGAAEITEVHPPSPDHRPPRNAVARARARAGSGRGDRGGGLDRSAAGMC
jgi:hypothetical protein